MRQIEPADQERVALDGDPQLPVPKRAGHSLHQRADQVVHCVELEMDRYSAGLQPGEIQQIRDEAIQPVGFLLDRDRPIIAARPQLMRQRLDGREWRPEIMRHRGDQGVLQAIRLSQDLGATGLVAQANSLHRQRGVVGQGSEEAPLSGIQPSQVLVHQLQHTDDAVADTERDQECLHAAVGAEAQVQGLLPRPRQSRGPVGLPSDRLPALRGPCHQRVDPPLPRPLRRPGGSGILRSPGSFGSPR